MKKIFKLLALNQRSRKIFVFGILNFMSNVLKYGCAIPFKEFPKSIILKNKKSSLNNAYFVHGAVLGLY